jgi:OmpA-OmpF porin, OOP family
MKSLCAIHVGVVALAALFVVPAMAQQTGGTAPKKVTGWYVGGAVGGDAFKTGYDQTKANVASTGATQATISADYKEPMWKAFLGYQVSPHVSIEGGYWNFGKPSYLATIAAPAATTMRRDFSVDGYGVSTVLWLPMTDAISGFGKIGVIWTTTKASAADPGVGLTPLPAESVRKFNPSWGLGLKYDFRHNMAARLELESVRNVGDAAKFGEADVVMWSLGMHYKF